MKILVIGGTGFLGRHIVAALLADMHQVSVLSRSVDRAAARLPDNVAVIQGDIALLGSGELKKLLMDFDGLVYGAGADERTKPNSAPTEFYYRENVEYCRRVLLATQHTNISHVVLLGSIFTHIHRTRPELALACHHPYIASRVRQTDMALAAARDHYILTVLEVPWVFGHSWGQESQWSALVNYARTATPLVSIRGGTVAISARNLARAASTALRRSQNAAIPIGDCNISWDDLLLRLSELSGRGKTKIVRLPDALFAAMVRAGGIAQKLFAAESGLDFAKMHEFLLEENYIDLKASQELLDYRSGRIDSALVETIDSTPEGLMANWCRKLAAAVSPQIAAKKQTL